MRRKRSTRAQMEPHGGSSVRDNDMKRLAGFLVLTSLATACDDGKESLSSEAVSAKVAKAAQDTASESKATAQQPAAAADSVVSDSIDKAAAAEQEAAKPDQPSAEAPHALAATPPGAAKQALALAPKYGAAAPEAKSAARPGAAKQAKDATEPTTAPPTRVVSGPTLSGEGYSVRLQTTSPVKVGEPSALTVVLNAEQPFKCNDKYPYKFTFDPIDGVAFENQVVRGMNVTDKRSTMVVPFSPKGAGEQSVSGTLSFSVCTDDKCLVEKQRLSVTFSALDS